MMVYTWLPEIEILNVLVNEIDVRQFLDGKHNGKMAATVSINLRHSF